MAKISKKAWVEVDIIAIVVIFILLVFLAFGLSWLQKSIVEITSVKERTNNDLFLINLLRSPYDKATIQEIMLSDYSTGNFDKTKEAVSSVLSDAFGENVCYTLRVNYIVTRVNKDCTKMTDLQIGELDSYVLLPLNEGDIKRVVVKLEP